jgi:hypothetical protein
MSRPSSPGILGRLAVAAFGLLSLAGAWSIVLLGGFGHAPKHSPEPATFVTGAPALFVAGLQCFAAGLAFTYLLRAWMPQRLAALAAFGSVAVPIALFLALR